MRRFLSINLFKIAFFAILLLSTLVSNAQVVQVEIIGGATIGSGSTTTITAGTSLNFRITNSETGNCGNLEIENVTVTVATPFSVTGTTSGKIKPESCVPWYLQWLQKVSLDFNVENTSSTCVSGAAGLTTVTIQIKNKPNFTFNIQVTSSPIINVLGGSPSADIGNGDTTTTDVNGTYFGVVEEGASVTRSYVIANTGSCALDITGLSSTVVTGTGFSITPGLLVPPTYTDGSAQAPTVSVAPGTYVVMLVTFTGPSATSGTQEATINIANSDNTTFSFNVRAEMFDFAIPGPGGITADFRLWLKATRGVERDATTKKVSKWADLGTNPKDATQGTPANQPTYKDDAASNINFNPVIKFENNGSTISQYLENAINGFYSQDIFIVMQPDDLSMSSAMTIFSGSISDLPATYTDDVNDVTAVGLGEYTANLTSELLWYNQGSSGSVNKYYALPADYRPYSLPGIINAGNKTTTVAEGMRIIYNGITDAVAPATNVATFENVGYIDTVPNPDIVYGTPYNIGKNLNVALGNLNGRVAEIFTFAERLSDTDREKVETYLALKYGITLGSTTMATRNYVNSFGTDVWDTAGGSNYDIAGIGRDDESDLNQKQSRTINRTDEVTIGLGGIFPTNSANPNEFIADGDFLVWGNNQQPFTANATLNSINIGASASTTVTRMNRIWKIVETIQSGSGGDVDRVFVSIPSASFGSFAKAADEEYALMVSDNAAFGDANIIDVIPLTADGAGNLQTWYDFDDEKFFTFCKAKNLKENHAVTIGTGDYMLGEYGINLNVSDFTISAWVKADASETSIRNVMSKGEKLQMRLNASQQVEILIDDPAPKFISTMMLDDDKWHQITFVYDSGSVFLYIDGVLDKSAQNVVAPSPNFNNYCIGALFEDKNNVSNHFLGDIDEVYIWDQKLTEAQVRYLMNQQAERFDVGGTDYVTGETIPFAASSNEVASIPWSQLKVYYDFNSFYGSTVEGLANIRYFMRMNYFDKDKIILSNQTAPLPYVSAADGDWDIEVTWKNGADQVLPNSDALDTPATTIGWNIAEISHDITSGDRDISLLGLVLKDTGKLTIAEPLPDPQDETNSGHGLVISHYLELDGVIDLVGESQLLQSEGSIVDADSGGYIERDQQGTANGFNYNYWSSSVGAIGGSTATRGIGVASTNPSTTIEDFLKNGKNSATYVDMSFSNVGYNFMLPLGPIPPGITGNIYTYWLYKFYGAGNDYYAWQKIEETTLLQAGEGFTMKGPLGNAPIALRQNYVFKGLPNNGNITLPLVKQVTGSNPSGNKERLVGNPYPSAMDATEFILDNMSIADGGNNASGTIFSGALYFWDHFGEENTHLLKGYVGGYATRNLTGGAAAISNDSRINNTSDAGSPEAGSKVPGQYIPINQGFFVRTEIEGFNNNNGVPIATVDGGNIEFKNSQRVYATEDGSTSLFFKSSLKKKNSQVVNQKETPLIRLIYDSPLGYHRQIVVGANNNASNNFDLGYDAFMADVSEEDMYWMLYGSEFVIQGVNNFNEFQEFPIGIKVKTSGLAKIKVETLENIEAELSLYIKDNLTNETYQITNKTFEVHLNAGTYNERFTLVFKSNDQESLSIVENDFLNEITIFYDSDESLLNIKTQNEYATILSVQVFNLLGQKIKSVITNSNEVSVPLSISTGVYIVKCHTQKGIINKKIIIH